MESPPPAGVPVAPLLRSSMLRGMSWMMGQAVLGRVLGLVSQVALAYLLLPAEFGLVGLAYTVTAFFTFITSSGAGDVLVHRHEDRDQWVGAVFWFAAALGAVLAATMVAVAPWAASMYDEPEIRGLIWILAVALLIDSLAVVPYARLRIDLAFGAIAKLDFSLLLVQTGLTIGLAAAGWGASSLVLPRPVVALLRLVIMWRLTRFSVPRSASWSKWPSLATQVSHVIAAEVALIIANQCDYIALGWYEQAAAVGLYFVAFNLSTQTLRLLSLNLLTVTQPMFSSLQHDNPRQLSVYLRCCRVMLGVGVTMCFLQAAAAEPVMHLVFPEKFWPAAPLLAILSLGMSLRMTGGIAIAVMKGNGRFLRLNAVTWGTTAVFAAFAFVAASQGTGSLGVAIAISLASVIYGPAMMVAALGVLNGRLGDLASIVLRSVLLAAVSVGPAWGLSLLIPDTNIWLAAAKLAILCVLSGVLFIVLVNRVDNELGQQLGQLCTGLLNRLRPPRLADPAEMPS